MKPASRKWMWASLLLMFVVGMGMGVAIDRLVIDGDGRPPGGGDPRARLVARLNSELGLTPQQQAEVEAVLDASRERARALWRESQVAHESFRNEVRQNIRALLEPEQQERFDEMIRRDDERRRRREQPR